MGKKPLSDAAEHDAPPTRVKPANGTSSPQCRLGTPGSVSVSVTTMASTSAQLDIGHDTDASHPGRDFQPAVDQRLFTAHQQPLARSCAHTGRIVRQEQQEETTGD
jgi:hypothetical protein